MDRKPSVLGRKRRRTYLAILLVVLLTGAIFASLGVTFYWMYFRGSSSTLENQKGGVGIGWGPFNNEVYRPIVSIDLTPEINNDSFLSIDFVGQFITNNTFVFALFSPFVITHFYPSADGYWSYQNLGGNSSVVYLSYTKTNKSILVASLNTGVGFYFKGLPYLYDHGRYVVVLPFGAGIPPAPYKFIQEKWGYFGGSSSTPLTIYLHVPAHDLVTSSVPMYYKIQPFYYLNSSQPSQAIEYVVNETSNLTVSYEDDGAISSYSNYQTLGLFLLGVGVPTLIASPAEIYREWNRPAVLDNTS